MFNRALVLLALILSTIAATPGLRAQERGRMQMVRSGNGFALILLRDGLAGSTPLMHGAFHEAARAVRDAREEVDAAEAPAAALAAMDRVLDALDDARAALWQQQHQPAVAKQAQRVWAVFTQQAKPDKSPEFLDGGCRAALDEFDRARRNLAAAREHDAAFEALDCTMRSLMKARRILWRQTQKAPRGGR